MGEDWVNAPAMWACYKKANVEYEKLELANHLVVNFHKEGHAVLLEDAAKMVAYFNKMHYGLAEEVDMDALKNSVFEGQV